MCIRDRLPTAVPAGTVTLTVAFTGEADVGFTVALGVKDVYKRQDYDFSFHHPS